MTIDTLRQIAEIPIIPLECVDALQSKGLRYLFCSALDITYNVFQECVDLASVTLTG